jgi:hypothetical protein
LGSTENQTGQLPTDLEVPFFSGLPKKIQFFNSGRIFLSPYTWLYSCLCMVSLAAKLLSGSDPLVDCTPFEHPYSEAGKREKKAIEAPEKITFKATRLSIRTLSAFWKSRTRNR